ncbi:MAG: adenylate/guanylate cyclase domain-containing protein [Planctomycetes bacterium]|nr:adenylate/guanylate cyclase domain-containing protein [Planctomycetota bacterium]
MKNLIKDRAKFRATVQAILVLCTISAVTKLLPASEKVLDKLDLAIYDVMMKKLVKKQESINNVVNIAITSEDLAYYQRESRMGWPWSRAFYNHVIGYCQKGKAKALMFDLLFTDFSQGAGDDTDFTEGGLKKWDKIYLLGEFQETAPKDMHESDQDSVKKYLPNLSVPVTIKDPKIKIRESKYARLPIDDMCDAGFKLAQSTDLPDFDAKSRRYNLLTKYDNYYIPNAALRILWELEGNPPVVIENGFLTFGQYRIPIDNKCQMLLKFYGEGRTTFKTINTSHVIQNNYIMDNEPEQKPTFSPEIFKDKIVLIGTYFPGMDIKKVPTDLSYPGVELHSTALVNIIAKDFLVELPKLWIIIWSIFYIPISVFTFRYIKAFLCKYALYGLIGIHVGLSIVFFMNNVWINAVPQISAILSSFITAMALNYIQEGKQKAMVKKTFQSYVSPSVVNKILDSSKSLNLQGERKRLTVMFLDFEGFTTLSEKLPAEELVALLKKYFTRIGKEIFATEGVIDKFIGDAVIAFWGDPLPQPDSSLRACRTALLARKAMIELRQETSHQLFARIGINTGDAIVGNMGSDTLFNYTVMGDEVNFTSRLEGANKQFGTRILISESTHNDAKDNILVREVGPVKVKGKQKAVRVYELVGIKGEMEILNEQIINTYNQGLQAFKSNRFDDAHKIFASMLQQDKDDKLAEFYCDLTNQLKSHVRTVSDEYVHELTSK